MLVFNHTGVNYCLRVNLQLGMAWIHMYVNYHSSTNPHARRKQGFTLHCIHIYRIYSIKKEEIDYWRL